VSDGRAGERGSDPARRLFCASFAMLFVELALIRWVAAYVVYVAYFTNFVLLASFLGIGVGFLRADSIRDRTRWVPLAVAGLAGAVFVLRVQGGRTAEGRRFTGLLGGPALPDQILLPLVFIGVVAAMALVAETVGRLFARFEPLQAYRIDILGSIAGIVTFSALSLVGAQPWVWGLVIASLALTSAGRPVDRICWIGAAAVVGAFALASISTDDTWSPYYRVTVSAEQADGSRGIKVNGLPHQGMVPIDRLVHHQPFYFDVYEHLDREPGTALVVGAGNGNDVAVALSEGATHVDAVEIDPVIRATGAELHPDRPYGDPRVMAIVDDGRAFLQRTDARYDLILFALPDSLTLVGGQGSLRLESYLFTEESMRAARDHLAPDGVLSMYNYYRPFVFQRYAETLRTVFGHAPCWDQGQGSIGPRSQAVLTIGLNPDDISCGTPWRTTGEAPEPATDDHPFPYLQGRTIPAYFLVALGLILLASLLIVRTTSGRPLSDVHPYLDLFFMGAAFLLLETMNVVRFALWFGTTWFVNALVFFGILVAVLLAVEVARRVRLPRASILYAFLAAALVIAWLIPPSALLDLAALPRLIAATGLAFLPVFLANLIFAARFRETARSTVAFGANLIGAMLGGVLEYGALVVGYRNLLVLVAALYGLAFAMRPRNAGPERADDRGAVPVRVA
jgi:spermine/spermidine synthase